MSALAWSPVMAQTRAEVRMTLRRGESVLLTLGIPVVLLVFFSLIDVLPVPAWAEHRVDFLAPGVLALAVLSAALVGVAIATAFERQYGVLKRLGTTPLGRPNLVGAKIAGVVLVELVQVVVITAVGVLLGWRPAPAGIGLAAIGVFLGTAAFAGLALMMAGRWKAEFVLAGANGLYLVLLLVSGMVVPLAKLPQVIRAIVHLVPSTALAEVLQGALRHGGHVSGRAWVVLLVWAVLGPLGAARLFRWE